MRCRFARVFSPYGTPLTDRIPVTAASAYYLNDLTITPTGGADFLLSWSDQTSTFDGEVYAQKFVDRTTIQFAAATAQVDESAGAVTITVTRTVDVSQPASVHYATLDESATPGADYSSRAGVLDFAANVASSTFTIPILDDQEVEGPETFLVQLSDVTGPGMVLGDPPAIRVTITDNDVSSTPTPTPTTPTPTPTTPTPTTPTPIPTTPTPTSTTPTPTTPTPSPASTVSVPPPHVTGVVVVRRSAKRVVSIALVFDRPLDPRSASERAAYRVLSGVKKRGKWVPTKPVPIRSVRYDDVAHSVTIGFSKPIKGMVQVTALRGIVAADGASSLGNDELVVR